MQNPELPKEDTPRTQADSDPHLEPIEDLEPADTPSAAPIPFISLETPRKTDNPHSEHLLRMVKLIHNPQVAQLILDKELVVVYASERTNYLFRDYYHINRKPFFNIFHQTLEMQDMKDLIISLKSSDKGFFWSGILKHKTATTKTMLTKTTINPFFTEKREIAGFHVLFEDVTRGYNAQLRATFNSILEAAKMKDNDTGMHNERVSYYCRKMSEYLYDIKMFPQIDQDFIDNIGFLGAMHDVGKIGTPDYILQKPGKLSELEWEIMREHTINGTFILSSYPVPMAKEIALSHHEWWNGTGYPFKLEGDMIPLAARIVTIADVYDALRMKRTYKNEYTHEESIQKIIAGRGEQFDPSLIEVFEQINADYNEIWNLLRDQDPRAPDTRDRSKEFPGFFY